MHHACRDGHEEFKVHLTATLCEVLETGCDRSGLEDFGSDHLSGLLVLDGLHEEGLVSVCVLDDDGVLHEFLSLDLSRDC